MSPEMLGGQPYLQEVDIWGVGIVIFIMLGGYHPFHDPSREVKEQQILNGKISFYPPYFAEVSDKAVNAIQRMMVTNPSHRISARDSLKLTWFAEETAETATEKTKLLKGRSWNFFRRFSKHAGKKGEKNLSVRRSTETQNLSFI